MDTSEVHDAIERIGRLSTIPVVLGRIMDATKDPSASPRQLYDIISHDPALAERVISMANSTFFRHAGRVCDIEQAILLLGYEHIRNIAVSMSVVMMFSKRSDVNTKQFWAHSYEVAFISAMVAESTTIVSPAEAFLTGLLHDIGRLIFYLMHREQYLRLLGTDDLLEQESAIFGCDHALAGSWLSQKSHMPREQVLAIRYHHAPSKATEFRDLTSVVSLSEVLSRRFSPKIEDDGIWTGEHDALLLELSLGNDDIADIGERLAGEEQELHKFLELV